MPVWRSGKAALVGPATCLVGQALEMDCSALIGPCRQEGLRSEAGCMPPDTMFQQTVRWCKQTPQGAGALVHRSGLAHRFSFVGALQCTVS